GLALAGVLLLVPVLGTARFRSLVSLQGTSLLRVKLWEASCDMALDHPWLGVGLDNFLYHYPDYIRPEAMAEPDLSHPHNWPLDFWLRLGLPGLAAFLWLARSFFRRALRLWRRRADPALTALTIGLIAAMVDMLAHGLIDAAFFVVELAALFALLVGLLRAMEEAA
ncbi:MAG TPA: O-antigen ligase family protein, partial [Anaerolineae bacterium]|nr:O-antigen ligase family protein [Anaerolineae bacterium]